MKDIGSIALGIIAGAGAGLLLGFCFICLLNCSEPQMQAVLMVHSVFAMIVMGAWVIPAMMPPGTDP